jgi:hypothetical protein
LATSNQSLDYIAKEKNKLLSAIQPSGMKTWTDGFSYRTDPFTRYVNMKGWTSQLKQRAPFLLLVMVPLLENNRASGLVIMWLLGMVMDTKETLRIWVNTTAGLEELLRHNRLCRQQGRSEGPHCITGFTKTGVSSEFFIGNISQRNMSPFQN